MWRSRSAPATSYKAGYTVVDGTAILPPLPDYTLPTLVTGQLAEGAFDVEHAREE